MKHKNTFFIVSRILLILYIAVLVSFSFSKYLEEIDWKYKYHILILLYIIWIVLISLWDYYVHKTYKNDPNSSSTAFIVFGHALDVVCSVFVTIIANSHLPNPWRSP